MTTTWSPTAIPKRPGSYFNFKAQPAVGVPPSVGSVVAVPFVHSWGPENEVVQLGSFAEFTAIYGNDLASEGYRAVRQAFLGENVEGRHGAGTVIAYRAVNADGEKAVVTLANATPASALTVTAVYQGTRGNDLKITVETNANDVLKKDFVVLLGLTEVKRTTFTPDDLAALAADVNATSDWVTLAVLIDDVALTSVSASPLITGDDGETLVAQDWTDAMDALETSVFDYFAPYNLTDSGIVASVKAWTQNANLKGRRFFTVLGGATDEAIADAIDRAADLNDPDIIAIGLGHVIDAEMVDENGDPVSLSTAQFVPRLAGILSALGESRSPSGARVAGVTLGGAATESQIEAAYDAGLIVLTQDSDVNAPVHIEKGLTTYTTASNDDQPYLIFRNPKYVRTMHDLQTEITSWVRSKVIGQLQVNSKTRSAVVAQMNAFLKKREEAGSIQPGWTVVVASDPPPSDDDDFIALDYGFAFGRSVEQILANITVR